MTIAELARGYRSRSFQFIAIGEHSQDLNEEKVQALIQQSSENSDASFCIIPGIEFSCDGDVHIFAPGTTRLIRQTNPVAVANEIRAQGGFAVLAHPRRFEWACPRELLMAVDAVEFWNVGYDGKFLPSPRAPREFRKMKDINPRLLAIAGHDLHKWESFDDVSVEMESPELSLPGVLENLRKGQYQIRSPYFCSDSKAHVSRLRSLLLPLLSWQIGLARRARNLLLRPSP